MADSVGTMTARQLSALDAVYNSASESKTRRESQMSLAEGASVARPAPPQRKGRGKKRHSAAFRSTRTEKSASIFCSRLV